MNFKYQGLGTYKRDSVGRFSSLKAKAYRLWILFKRTVLVSVILFLAGAFGATFYSTSTVTAITNTVEAESPILDRIALCESKGNQNGTSGQVIIHINANGTYDVGKYQINSIHNAAATKLGFNLMTEEGNYAYAKWLYANKGTSDWSSSAKCWQK